MYWFLWYIRMTEEWPANEGDLLQPFWTPLPAWGCARIVWLSQVCWRWGGRVCWSKYVVAPTTRPHKPLIWGRWHGQYKVGWRWSVRGKNWWCSIMCTPLQPVCYLLRSIASPYPLKKSVISLSLCGSIGLHPWQNNCIINAFETHLLK